MEATVKRRKLFRNQWPSKKFYLRSRDPEKANQDFVLLPGATVEALDESEEKLLDAMGLVDVEKESPAVASAHEALQKELAAEKAKNAQLQEDNKALGVEVEKSKRHVTAVKHAKR